jgi:plastocyanin
MKVGIFVILIIALLLLTGTATAAMEQVLIRHFQFQPSVITINKGDTVTWMHPGPVGHTVKFTDSESQILTNGGTYSKTFNQKGTFNYECGIHPSMKGTVIVK